MPSLVRPDGETGTDRSDRPWPARLQDLDPQALPERPAHTTVLLTWPATIEPTGVATDDGSPGVSDRVQGGESDASEFRTRAYRQWRALRRTFEHIGSVDVVTMNPLSVWDRLRTPATPDDPSPADRVLPPEELPDAVFCANVALPFPDEKRVLLSEMAAPSRRDEPAYAAEWFERNGYEVATLQNTTIKTGREAGTNREGAAGNGDERRISFEGTGDAIWHPGRRLLWGGVGERTDRAVYDEIANRMNVPVVTLDPTGRIDDDVFFHLDVCFAPLDERTVLLVREVFDDEDLAVIESAFDRVIDCPYEEGRPTGAYGANVFCPDGEHVLVPAGATRTIDRIERAGFTVHPLDTSAFIEGCAGSVFCMKLALP